MRAVPRLKVICSCGREFLTKESLIRSGRGKFCSTLCARSKPVPEAQKQLQRQKMIGRHSSPATQFKKGLAPWNKGKKFPERSGTLSPFWVGDEVGYYGLHDWVEKVLGKPNMCEYCGTKGKMEWANKSHEYKRDAEDWLRLCRRCHVNYDRISGHWGTATRKFAL